MLLLQARNTEILLQECTHYIKYFPFACSSGRSSYHTDYLFRINCNHVYWDRIAEETGSRCKAFVCKIWETVGGSRSIFICAGRIYCKHRILSKVGVNALVVITVAVLAIVLTAPAGAFAMDLSYKKFLKKG